MQTGALLRVEMAIHQHTTSSSEGILATSGMPPIAFGVFLAVDVDVDIVALKILDDERSLRLDAVEL